MTNEAILETLQVQPLSEEEKQKRHILKRLMGPIASCKDGTRNGRKYNKDLWEQALNDDVFKEKIANKGLFLELGHPDREEIDMASACACIPETPKIINNDLYAIVDVLDTPAGRILNTLIDYGFKPGISSRGTGDVVGDEVDPDTFILETWDIVNVPALQKARLSIAEGLDKNTIKLKQALNESLNKASVEDRKIIEESLRNLNIDISTTPDKKDSVNIEKTSTKQPISEIDANNNGSKELIKSLQEAIKEKAVYEEKIKSLQEQLIASNNRISKLESKEEEQQSISNEIGKLKESLKIKSSSNLKLKESLNKKEQQIKILTEVNSNLIDKQKRLNEQLTQVKLSLKEQTNDSVKEVNSLQESNKSLNETVNKLKEELNSMSKDNAQQIETLKNKLKVSNQLNEKYKKATQYTLNRYIESKATMLGISANEIKNKLNETYTMEDIDNICEDLKTYHLNMSKLPFDLKDKRVKITESKESEFVKSSVQNDDDIDEELLNIAGL